MLGPPPLGTLYTAEVAIRAETARTVIKVFGGVHRRSQASAAWRR
jgi:hypothetical protein